FGSEDEISGALPRGAVRMTESPFGTTLVGTAVDMSMIVSLLQGRTDRVVVDKTDFKPLFDFNVQFAKDSGPVPPPDTPIPTLFAALQDMNLKLESGKALLPVLIVDSVSRPSPN